MLGSHNGTATQPPSRVKAYGLWDGMGWAPAALRGPHGSLARSLGGSRHLSILLQDPESGPLLLLHPSQLFQNSIASPLKARQQDIKGSPERFEDDDTGALAGGGERSFWKH